MHTIGTEGAILNTQWTLADFYEHSFGALENCYRCKPIQGSNPCPSAKFVFCNGRCNWLWDANIP
jgi:hypothetical protein